MPRLQAVVSVGCEGEASFSFCVARRLCVLRIVRNVFPGSCQPCLFVILLFKLAVDDADG